MTDETAVPDEIHLVIVGSVASAWDAETVPIVKARIREVITRYQLRTRRPTCCPHPEDRHMSGFCKDCPRGDATHRLKDVEAPFLVGSGESPEGGVDIWVREVATEMRVDFVAFAPKARGWPFYKKRNQAMADWCTVLVRISSRKSATYGSGYTHDRAKEQGKPTEEHLL